MSSSTTPLSETAFVTSPPVSSVAPLRISGIQAVTRSRLLTVPADARLVEVAARLSDAHMSVAVVCDEAGAVMGTITETMLVKYLGLGQANFFSTHASNVMTREFATCATEELLSDVLAMMQRDNLVHVLLTNQEQHPLGVLNARDGLRELLAAGSQEEALLRNYVMGVGYQ